MVLSTASAVSARGQMEKEASLNVREWIKEADYASEVTEEWNEKRKSESKQEWICLHSLLLACISSKLSYILVYASVCSFVGVPVLCTFSDIHVHTLCLWTCLCVSFCSHVYWWKWIILSSHIVTCINFLNLIYSTILNHKQFYMVSFGYFCCQRGKCYCD